MGLFLDVVLVLLAAEISLAHAFVIGDLLRAAGCEDGALRHHRDVVGDLENDLHVVLDNDDVDHPRELADFADRALGFSRAHPAGRLVEQKEPRPRDQRHADLEQRDVTVGQRAGLPLRELRQPDLLEGALDLLPCVEIARGGAERIEKASPAYPVIQRLSATLSCGNTLLFCKVRLMPRRLISCGSWPVMSWPSEEHAAAVRRQQARNQIEERGLARAVRPDDGVQPAAGKIETQPVDGGEPAEALGELQPCAGPVRSRLGPQFRLGRRRSDAVGEARSASSCHRPTIPLGAKITTRIATTPTTNA